MKTLRFSFFAIIFLMTSMIFSCVSVNDANLPEPTASATEQALIGNWEAYEILGGPVDDRERTIDGAGVTITPDYGLTVYRKFQPYPGTWSLSRDGGYATFRLDIQDQYSEPLYPGTWSILKIDANEFWIATGAKRIKMRRVSAPVGGGNDGGLETGGGL